ncbi:hypothetical protein D8674_039001 [Pyrus ussuriensis x Pyrus communis]|uniref:Uncharacterized protein n=1 Tax=Pyrus ussuriensis x Pyrus communis TaxID=2448454 RepID=A0A5N5HAX4_9ROSA|nr:hypothetical protein D8674_039001 [Pyrus ussuriensis x Pyrus communis]
MMEEYDRIAHNQNSKSVWLRLFPRTSVHENGELPWWLRRSDRGRSADERRRVRGSCFDLLFSRREEDRWLKRRR